MVADQRDFLYPDEAAGRWGELTMLRGGKDPIHCTFRELDGFVWTPVFDTDEAGAARLVGYRRSVDTIGLLAKGQ